MRRCIRLLTASLLVGLLGIAGGIPSLAAPKDVPNCVGQIRRYEAQHLDPNLGQVVKYYATNFGAGYGQFVASVAVSGEAPEWVEPGCE